jgi:ankyrin repeat protein
MATEPLRLDDLNDDILFMIADEIANEDSKRCFADLNSFLRAKKTFRLHLNPILWKKAAKSPEATKRVLTQIINTGNLGQLEYFLELGVNVETCLPDFDTHGEHAKDYPGPTALIAAAYKDSVPMAQLLLEKGAMVQYPPNSGLFSAIHAARSAEMVQLLLDNHADPEMRAWHTRPTPLDWYAYRGDVAAMRAVLQLGRFSVQEVWALLVAVQSSREAVELLIQYGADVRTTLDSCGATTLHYAARAGKLDIVTL